MQYGNDLKEVKRKRTKNNMEIYTQIN